MNLTFFLATSSSTPVTHAVHYGLLVIYFVIRNTPSRTICKSSRLSSSQCDDHTSYKKRCPIFTTIRINDPGSSSSSSSSEVIILITFNVSSAPLAVKTGIPRRPKKELVATISEHQFRHHHNQEESAPSSSSSSYAVAQPTYPYHHHHRGLNFPSFERRRSVRSLVACHGQWDNGAEEGQQ